MDGRFAALHRLTPRLHLGEPRGLMAAAVDFHRLDEADERQARIQRTVYDVAGRPVSHWDARLWADQAPGNISVIHSLSGRPLLSESVDAGWRLELPGVGGQTLEVWDSRAAERHIEYDPLLRPVALVENLRYTERLTYGTPDSAIRNQCGRRVRHDDPAGTCLDAEFGLTGQVIEQTRHFLQALDAPDWPEALTDRDALLEPGSGSTTRWVHSPIGEVMEQADALGNVQRFVQTVAGEMHACRLQLNGQPEQMLVNDIRYDAQGRVESETAGNGVVTTARYGAEDGRLLELKAVRSSGELLQNLIYDYDPVGNVTRIEDLAQPIRYFANQRIEPVSSYQYDTLYQLVEATGRELAVVNHGPVFADFQSPPDPAQLANYTQTYRYDAGGNLQQLTHVGSQSHSQTLVTAKYSNRSLPAINSQPPDEDAIAAAFDANGNLLQLQPGQPLAWNARNQLQEVRPVLRDSGLDDSERYIYDASGQRLRKVRTTQAKAVTHIAEVRYLPGLEIRTDTATGETLHVITAQAGRNGVRVLHWQAGKPTELSNDQVRYSLTDHLGSSSLEFDALAQIISQESYYPFGGTSWWAGRNAVEASYKTVRYSGKERDATGLYHYGFRYYAPWLQRWINPDPAGAVDGLNLFCFVRNKPSSGFDSDGQGYQGTNDSVEKHVQEKRKIRYRGVKELKKANEDLLVATLDVAIEEGLSLMKAEVQRLKNNDVEALFNFIGVPRPTSLDKSKPYLKLVTSGYEKLIAELSHYQAGGKLREQLVFVEGESPLAFVFKNDDHKRIFLTDQFRAMSAVSNLHTLIHELSHSILDTKDKFYYEGFDIDHDLPPDSAASYMRLGVARAVRRNQELFQGHDPAKHGTLSFRAWLTTVADFWGAYMLSHITSERAQLLHTLPQERVAAKSGKSGKNGKSTRLFSFGGRK